MHFFKPKFLVSRQARRNATHYNAVTDAWKYVLGDNLHVGYFDSGEEDLDKATDRLIDEMASLGDIKAESQILDVGCGVGWPAFHLHERFGCRVVGISTSDIGIQRANVQSEKRKISEAVRFQVADGLDNGFPNESFDVVWVMESSHLIGDKRRLITECARVLKPGGNLLLCDFMLSRYYNLGDRFSYLAKLKLGYILGILSMIEAFGRVTVETFDFYQRAIVESGLTDLEVQDISRQVAPTFKLWVSNIEKNREQALNMVTSKQIDHLSRGTKMCDFLFGQKVFSYGIVKAVKPQRQ